MAPVAGESARSCWACSQAGRVCEWGGESEQASDSGTVEVSVGDVHPPLTSDPATTSDRKRKREHGDKGKGKAKAVESEDEDDNIEAEMDAELKALLESAEGEEGENMPMDYNLIKNFLESFKNQAGLSGPVSNLAGRLQPGWKLPRDEA